MSVQDLKLTTNMQVHFQGGISAGHFAQHLLILSEGKLQVDASSGLVRLQATHCHILRTMARS